MKFISNTIFSLFFLLSNIFLFGQNPAHYIIDETDGLPSNVIYDINQDHLGYIYLGTDIGLYRYDGFEFKKIPCTHSNSENISHIVFDKLGRLWCQNFSGHIYYKEGDSLHIFKDFSKRSTIFPKFLLSHDYNVWISSLDTLYKYNMKGDLLRTIDLKPDSILEYNAHRISKSDYHTRRHLYFLKEYAPNKIVSVCSYGLLIYDEGKDSNSIHYHPNQRPEYQYWARGLKNKKSTYILFEATGIRNYYLYQIPPNGKAEKINSLLNNRDRILNCRIQEDGSYWLLGSSGARYFEVGDSSCQYHLLKDKTLSGVFVDREGNHWFSSLGHGLIVIPFMEIQKLNYIENGKDKNNFSVMEIYGDTIFLGTHSGEVFEANLKTKTYRKLVNQTQAKGTSIKHLIKSKNHLFILNSVRSFFNLATSDFTFCGGAFRHMAMGQDSIWYYAPYRMIYSCTKDLDHLTPLCNNGGAKPMSLSGRGFGCDYKGQFWVGAYNGVTVLSAETLKPVKLDTAIGRIYSSKILAHKDLVIIGSINQGVLILKDEKVIQRFDKSNGFEANTILKLHTDDQNRLLILTDEGIYLYDIETKMYKFYGKELFPNIRSAIDVGFYKNQLIVCTIRGIYSIPIDIRTSSSKFTPYITHINNEQVPTWAQQEVVLAANQRDLNIKFKAIHFKSRSNLSYMYRLSGFSKEWTRINARTDFANFKLSRAGKYIFEVKAVDSMGQHSEISTLEIRISPYFWETYWFTGFIIAIIILFLYVLYRFQIGRLKRRAKNKETLIGSQLTALKAQMNPHFMYNALNSIQDLVLQQDIRKTNYYLTRFSWLMRQILEVSGSKATSIAQEAKLLNLYLELEKLRFGDDFNYEISLSEDMDADYIFIPSMLIQPFVENSVKHGLLHKKSGTKDLWIKFYLEDKNIVCSIEDNGIGRERSTEINQRKTRIRSHKSFATSAIQKRIELINSFGTRKVELETVDLYDEYKTASGTRVILKFPIQTEEEMN
ncbi:MAG: histidine kinase [Saprospiraceae bacterium]|nr:histidine kinase [Saprospiraceae bacterium]